MHIRIANAPTSWGIEDPEDGANPPWPQVLDQTAAAGYAGIELGPLGYLPERPRQLRREPQAPRPGLVARLAAERHGLLPCFHPHAGTHVEFEQEIERLAVDTDPELVQLCIDTGHC